MKTTPTAKRVKINATASYGRNSGNHKLIPTSSYPAKLNPRISSAEKLLYVKSKCKIVYIYFGGNVSYFFNVNVKLSIFISTVMFPTFPRTGKEEGKLSAIILYEFAFN
jgi:hypothetical protein